MLKISYAGCPGLFFVISSQFKNPYYGSFKVIDVIKFKKPVTCDFYDMQHVCTYLQPFSHYTSQ